MLNKGARKQLAKRDITVYKMLERSKVTLRTAYMKCKVEIGNTYTSDITTNKISVEKALHSFTNKREAIERVKTETITTVELAECVIPKGSYYYKGIFSSFIGEMGSIASDTLTYIKLIKI